MDDDKSLSDLSTKELEELAHHNIPIENLLNIANPLGCWVELNRAITKEEVMECVKKKDYEIVDTPLWSGISRTDDPEELRYNHIRKIAYFVVNEPQKPIRVDIGFPEFGGNIYNFHAIDDGNHRLSGDYLAGRTHVKGHLLGCTDYAKELGIYNPNKYEIELAKRYNQEFLEIKEKEMNVFIDSMNNSKKKKKNGNYEITFKMGELNKYDDLLINCINKKNELSDKELLFKSLKLEDVDNGSIMPECKVILNKKEATLLFGKGFDRKNKLKR